MKKISLIVLIFLAGTVVYCQTRQDSLKRKGFSIEPYLGLGTSEAVQNGTNNLAGRIGCGVNYMFNEHWGISSGLQVQRYSTGFTSGKDSVYMTDGQVYFWNYTTVSASYNFTYLELPILIRYVSSHANITGIFAEAGFIVGYSIIHQEDPRTLNVNEVDTTSQPLGVLNGGSFYNTYSYSGPLGNQTPFANSINLQGHLAIGFYYPFSKRCSLITDFSINKGFTNVGNSSNDILNYSPTPFYYYKKNNNYSPSVSNYGTNFSGMVSVRLNIKLGK